ncbi:MAG TPA: radical SAM protein, partial [Clostridiales bacterium]|nr:radical SAM protein [Clostridiales bacterium]
MVTITGVEMHSPAYKKGILPGDELVSINGHLIFDVLDYRFYLTEKTVCLSLLRDHCSREVTLHKKEYEDIGLTFASFLMDEKKRCSNACVFCFVDQNPPGMRESIYFKDDDTRLSFLHGSYVTLTNCKDKDVERIAAMHISPLRVSVHSTRPELRCKLLGNRYGGNVSERLLFLTNQGIEVHCQIVLCKGLNDGAELDRTLTDLLRLEHPPASIAVVPAGLTKHRDNLYPLTPFTPEECRRVIRQVAKYQEKTLSQRGTRCVWAADEFYTRGGVPHPPKEGFYEGYPQLDNGIGLLASFEQEVEDALKTCKAGKSRKISLATGEAAASFLSAMVA